MRYRLIRPQTPDNPEKKIRWDRLLRLAVSFILIGGFYLLGIYMRWKFVVRIYVIALTLLLIAAYFLSSGFAKQPPDPSRLPKHWNETQRERFLTLFRKNREILQKLMYVLLPLVTVLLIDAVYLFLFDLF